MQKVKLSMRLAVISVLVASTSCPAPTGSNSGKPNPNKFSWSCLKGRLMIAGAILTPPVAVGVYHAWATGVFADSPKVQFEKELKRRGLTIPPGLKIVHLGQTHYVKKNYDDALAKKDMTVINEMATSQATVARTIQKYTAEGRPFTLFSEGVLEPLTVDMRKRINDRVRADSSTEDLKKIASELGVPSHAVQACNFAKHFFPNGIPKDKFEPNQLMILIRGATRILWCLGEIDEIPTTEDAATHERAGKRIEAQVNGGFEMPHQTRAWNQEVYIDREIQTLVKIIEHYQNNKIPSDAPALLVFGAGHDFIKYQVEGLTIEAKK